MHKKTSQGQPQKIVTSQWVAKTFHTRAAENFFLQNSNSSPSMSWSLMYKLHGIDFIQTFYTDLKKASIKRLSKKGALKNLCNLSVKYLWRMGYIF